MAIYRNFNKGFDQIDNSIPNEIQLKNTQYENRITQMNTIKHVSKVQRQCKFHESYQKFDAPFSLMHITLVFFDGEHKMTALRPSQGYWDKPDKHLAQRPYCAPHEAYYLGIRKIRNL